MKTITGIIRRPFIKVSKVALNSVVIGKVSPLGGDCDGDCGGGDCDCSSDTDGSQD